MARDRKARQTKIHDLDKSNIQDLLVSPDKVPVGERLMESSLCDVVRVRKELECCWKGPARVCLVGAERDDQMKVQLRTRRKV